MDIVPSLRSCRFDQLAPGDLFFMRHDRSSYVALTVKDPKSSEDPNANDHMVLLLGPTTSESLTNLPLLASFQLEMPVVSFSKNYTLRLPSSNEEWLATEPPIEHHCLVLSEDKAYIRALFGVPGRMARCYIEVKEGILLTDAAGRFAYPNRGCAYTLDWALLTAEKNAHQILSFPQTQ